MYDAYAVLGKVYGGGTYVKQAISSTDIEPKNKSLTVKCVYGVLENDILLDYYIKNLADRQPKAAVRLILKISLYLIKFTDKPVYTVTNEAVDLAKKLGKGGVAGFINAALRKFAGGGIELPSESPERLSVEYSYPPFALEMLIKEYGTALAKEIIAFRSDDVSVRLVKNKKYYIDNYSLRPTPFEDVYLCKGFKMESGFERGEYTFQSAGSVAVCDAVEPCGQLLDACAAPGGKSVLLAAKCKQVTACDIHAHRVELIEAYAARMGVENVNAVLCDSSAFKQEFFERFDTVLVDAPCSGFGVAHENPDIKLGRKKEDIAELTKIQLKILKNCANYVKKGGFLYYSTCSVFEVENGNTAESFLKADERYEPVEITSPLPHIKKGYGLQFLPHISCGAGFYIVKLKRVK